MSSTADDHAYRDCEFEVFACGQMRDRQALFFAEAPSLPQFEDDELIAVEEARGEWWCYARPTTDAAGHVSLHLPRGGTGAAAIRLEVRGDVEKRDGYAAAEEYLALKNVAHGMRLPQLQPAPGVMQDDRPATAGVPESSCSQW